MRADTRMQSTPHSFVPAMVAAVLIAVLGATGHAQRPERQQEVSIPGLGITLKAGWQLRFHDGCRYAVPPAWRVTANGSQAFAPDGSSLSVWALHVPNWSLHKSQIKAAFGRVRSLREDSDQRLWIEAGDDSRMQQYVAVTDGSIACEGLLEIRSPSSNTDTAQTIANGIGAGPVAWSWDLK